MKDNMTIVDATREWVKEFNAFPLSMIERLFTEKSHEWNEVTAPCIGIKVDVYPLPEKDKDGNDYNCEDSYGEIIEIEKDNDECDSENVRYLIELDDAVIRVPRDHFDVIRDDYFPMWGTMWQFADSCDNWWLEEDNGIELMSQCGFRVYEHDEWGYFFGVDGAGYDFYEAHWIPLYKARGLHWHSEEEPTTSEVPESE